MATTIPVPQRPEDVLDNFVKNEMRSAFPTYVGVFNLAKLEPLKGAFLTSFKDTINEALRPKSTDASGGVDHPRFHFDYLEVNDGVLNAHAFDEGGYAFIVVTMPLVDACGDLALALCRSPAIRQLLQWHDEAEESDNLQGPLFQNLMLLLVGHEHSHHVHKHTSGTGAMVWTEFLPSGPTGSLQRQGQELDADAYAGYRFLQHLLRGPARSNTLARLKQQGLSPADADQVLLALFFITVIALFCLLWSGRKEDTSNFSGTSHPLPPVRINYILRVAKMWCEQNELESLWLTPAGSQELFRAVAEVFEPSGRATWDAQIASLVGPAGAEYEVQLFKAFEAERQKGLNSDAATA